MSLLTRDDYERLWRATDPWAGIPPRYNLGHALTAGNVAAGRGERVCLYWENSAGDARQLTYAQLDEASNRWALALAALGVRRGERVLLRLPNLPEFYIAALGAAKLGAVFIPSSTLFRAAEIAYRLRDAEVVAVVTTTGLAGEVEMAMRDLPRRPHLIAVPYAGEPLKAGQLDFNQLLHDGAPDFAAADTAHDDVAFVAYTSGTTGDPKGVVHEHRYPISYETLVRYWHAFRDDDVVTCPAEMGWLLPVASTFLYAMRSGVSVVLYHALDGRFSPAAWFRLFAKYRVTNFVGTPTMYRMLVNDPGLAGADLSSLRHGTSAGEPLPPDTFHAVREHLGFSPLDGIGMSECMVYCHAMQGFEIVPGSCGRPSPGVEIRVLDEDLNEVPDGTEGVLCVRRGTHPGMMREYLNKPAQTAEVFRGDWYYSGDVLVRDAEGRFWFRGRADDLIKASGYRISPFEVESCLAEHPAVLEAAAVACPDELRGDVVKAFVVLRPGTAPSDTLAEQLQDWVKARAAPYKYPRRVEFVAELPKTQSGKVKRRLLRDLEIERRRAGT
ncbi:MAG: AMP-binding protein [Pirellulales bacterium]|nr:AMP-binding protein [Pirellulales bacterium]